MRQVRNAMNRRGKGLTYRSATSGRAHSLIATYQCQVLE